MRIDPGQHSFIDTNTVPPLETVTMMHAHEIAPLAVDGGGVSARADLQGSIFVVTRMDDGRFEVYRTLPSTMPFDQPQFLDFTAIRRLQIPEKSDRSQRADLADSRFEFSLGSGGYVVTRKRIGRSKGGRQPAGEVVLPPKDPKPTLKAYAEQPRAAVRVRDFIREMATVELEKV